MAETVMKLYCVNLQCSAHGLAQHAKGKVIGLWLKFDIGCIACKQPMLTKEAWNAVHDRAAWKE